MNILNRVMNNLKIVSMIPTFNDEDIISEVIENMIEQGTFPVVLDNGSSDNTFNICKKFSKRGEIKLSRFYSESFNISSILEIAYDMALIEKPDWIVLCGSDEFLESGSKNFKLSESISKIDSEGYNLIQFNRFDFFMSDDDKSAKTIREKLRYYSFQDDFLYRSWKFVPGIRLLRGGHYPFFPEGEKYNICPRKLVMRHYTFRSKEQAEKKMRDRINRKLGEKKSKEDMNQKLKNVLNHEYTKNVDHNLLTKYNEDNQWNLERKYAPYVVPHPKKSDIFSDDGFLKTKPLTALELSIILKEKNKKIIDLKKRLEELKNKKELD